MKDNKENKVITETLNVTLYLAEYLPSLFPSEKMPLIKELLTKLHAHNFFTLTFGPKEGTKVSPELQEEHKGYARLRLQNIDTILAKEGISEKYKKQMEYKRKQ